MIRDRLRSAVCAICAAAFVGAACVSAAAATQSADEPALRSSDGRPLTLAQFRGRTVLVNFWATWCAPCRKEMPDLNRLAAQLDAKRAVILGIAADDPAAVQTFVDKLAIRYPIASGDADAVFAWTAKLGNAAEGLPFTVLLDRDGTVRWRQSGGALDIAATRVRIEQLVAEGSDKQRP